ncbi:MAG: Nre family DNA repair protein [Candidatus Hydrothermarchaeales archaeon]
MKGPFNTAGLKEGQRDSLCVICKGSKMLCGKTSCPILVKYYYHIKTQPMIDDFKLDGSSPPSVFIGRMGYPKVYVGPLIPPISGDTSLLDMPELWLDKSIRDIVSFRSQLVRGKHLVEVHNVEGGGKIVDATRELAMSKNPVDSEAEFSKKPSGRLVLDDEVQPFGPSAPLKKFDTSSLKIDRKIDRAYGDTDLRAAEAVIDLHKSGILVSQIQRSFSVGAFGLGKNRRFVPTRWSITAVDDTISKDLREKVKDFPLISDYRVYESWRLDNRFMVLQIPSSWCYELIEAWYPNTVWNPRGSRIFVYSSHEGYEGRSKYAEIGGCYYAARLAVTEKLGKEKRQAATVILREAHPGYIMPVGVWNVRENVRNALRGKAMKFDTLKGALDYVFSKLDIPKERWILNSKLLKDFLYQRRLEDFMKGRG